MRLSDNTILVTGGASGIGLALARSFLDRGNRVIVCGRDRQKIEAAARGQPALVTLRCDITDQAEVQELVDTIENEFSSLNVLVNNAGVQFNYRFDDGESHLPLIDAETSANFTSHVRLTDALLPLLLAQPEAAIINVSSALSRVPKESAPVYCATKAAIHVFSKALRYQLENTPVKVFEIVPALVDTAMTAGRGRGKISPAALAEEALRGIERDRFYIKIGKTKVLFALHRLCPALADRIIRQG